MVRQSQESVHLLLSALCSNESSEDDAIDFGEFSLVFSLCLSLASSSGVEVRERWIQIFLAVSQMFSSQHKPQISEALKCSDRIRIVMLSESCE